MNEVVQSIYSLGVRGRFGCPAVALDSQQKARARGPGHSSGAGGVRQYGQHAKSTLGRASKGSALPASTGFTTPLIPPCFSLGRCRDEARVWVQTRSELCGGAPIWRIQGSARTKEVRGCRSCGSGACGCLVAVGVPLGWVAERQGQGGRREEPSVAGRGPRATGWLCYTTDLRRLA